MRLSIRFIDFDVAVLVLVSNSYFVGVRDVAKALLALKIA